jgi:hypothetical protein
MDNIDDKAPVSLVQQHVGNPTIEPTAAQNKRLLAYLRENGSINPMAAWHALGIYRLGARVFELRQDGHNITTTRVEVSNRFGERCFVAIYKLEQGK